MKFGSVCSGIEAASAAWHPLGWKCAFVSEIDKFPSAVLAHHYPDVPNLGDMTKFKEWPDAPELDVLVGGTPCQSFSVAGLRAGLDDPRGNLMLTYAAIAGRYRPSWLVWENVPGVLSSEGGRDFGSLLGLLSGRAVEVPAGGWQNSGILPGHKSAYGLAWRVLDAQYFGVPQRRRRVFVVGYLGDWRPAAAVLLERESLCGNPAPRREKRKGAPAGTIRSTDGGSDVDHARAGHLTAEVAPPLSTGTSRSGGGRRPGMAGDDAAGLISVSDVAPTLSGAGNRTGGDRPYGTQVDTADSLICMSSGQANAEIVREGSPSLTCLHEAPIIAFDETQITSDKNFSHPKAGDPCHPLARGARPPAIAFTQNQREEVRELEVAGALESEPGSHQRTYVAFDCKRGSDASEVSPPLRALNDANSHAAGGGHVAVAIPINADALRGEGTSVTPSADAAGRVRLRDPGFGVGVDGDPAGTIAAAGPGAVAFGITDDETVVENGIGTIGHNSPTGGGHPPAVAFKPSHYTRGKDGAPSSISPPLSADADKGDQDPLVHVKSSMQVRRLTPRECERLQDFPDDYTLIPYGRKKAIAEGIHWAGDPKLAADGPRYKALGNSMARCVMVWLGQRIQAVHDIIEGAAA